MAFPTDLEIARSASLKPLVDAEEAAPEYLEHYGDGIAKIKLDSIEAMEDLPKARYVIVSAIRLHLEKEDDDRVGLGQGFKHIGKKATAVSSHQWVQHLGSKGGCRGWI